MESCATLSLYHMSLDPHMTMQRYQNTCSISTNNIVFLPSINL